MDGLLFIIFGIFLVLLVYACYPWIQGKIKPFLTKMNTEIVPLEESSPKTIYAEKSWALTDFFKRFVLYIAQPILHGFS